MKRYSTILLIEDDTWFAEQQSRTLRAAGFKVRHASDGLAAIEAIDHEQPDVVVLDVFLPGPNAFTLLHEMKSYSDLAVIPVVLCTSSAADIAPDWLKAYGVVSVLDKSTMYPQDIVAAVRKALP